MGQYKFDAPNQNIPASRLLVGRNGHGFEAAGMLFAASVNLCYNTGDWVYDARRFAVAVSDNGTDFREVAAEDYPEMTEDQYGSGISTHALKFAPVKARYVKVTLSPEYNMPENRGFEAFIFVDEIKLR